MGGDRIYIADKETLDEVKEIAKTIMQTLAEIELRMEEMETGNMT